MGKLTWGEKLKRWRKAHDEQYAKAIMSPPEHTTLLQAIPLPGVILIMGAKGMGKSALAHDIAEKFHKSKRLPAVLHLPRVPAAMQKQIQSRLPSWNKVVTSTEQWPKKCVVIYDEAAQSAHARRTQSGEAVELDNLMSISRQRQQLIIFISHHSRKLDPNVIRDIDRIVWKTPTYAHWIFERNELTDFVLKAVDFFSKIKGDKARQKTTLMMNFHDFQFREFSNGVPSYWCERLSHLFEDIKSTKKGGSYF